MHIYNFYSPLFPCTSAKLEKDVKEALFAIAKQQGKVDPDVSVYVYIHVHTCTCIYMYIYNIIHVSLIYNVYVVDTL